MAHRFIIDDQTGQLYKDFTGRRLTSAAEVLKAERGLAPTFEIFLINVASDTGAVTTKTLTNAQLSVAIGSASKPPETGIIKATWTTGNTVAESIALDVESLTPEAIAGAFNTDVYIKYLIQTLEVEQIGLGKYLITTKNVGTTTGSPSFNVEGVDPPTGVEVTQITTGSATRKAQWIVSLAQLPVASIAKGSFSVLSSGSFSGLTNSISLNTTGMLASIGRGQRDFEFSIVHNNQLLHRSQVTINESLDPTASGTVIVTSPNIFTLGSNGVLQGESIALSGGLTYDGTTLNSPHLQLTGGTMSGAVAMGSNKITGLADGTASGDAVNKSQLDALVDSAPGALNTLNELAAALGNDASFSTNVTNSIATKLPLAGGTLSGSVIFNDNVKGIFGTSSDGLEIYHDGSSSKIVDQGTGRLTIETNGDSIRLTKGTSENMAIFTPDGSVDLYYDNSKKFETTNDGIQVTGSLTANTGSGAAMYGSHIDLGDSQRVRLGAGDDLQIYHDGSHSYIINDVGHLYIRNETDDNDIIFQCDDGSGGTETYFRLDGSFSGGDPYTIFPDNSNLVLGTGGDLAFRHDGTNSSIKNHTGDLVIEQNADDKDIIFKGDNGSGGTETYFYLDGSASGGNPVTVFPDSSFLSFGTGFDFSIYHDSSNTYLANSTNDLYIQNNANDRDVFFRCDDGSGGVTTYFHLDGGLAHSVASKHIRFEDNVIARFGSGNDASLYHTGTDTIFENANGDLYIKNHADDKDIIFQCDDGSGSVETYFYLDGSASSGFPVIRFPDNSMITLGTDNDLYFRHDGTNTYLENNTGDFYIRANANDKDIIFQCDNGSGGLETYFFLDGSVGGATPYTVFPDDSRLAFGNVGDGSYMHLLHDATNSYIENKHGHLFISNYADDKDIIFQADDGSGGTETYFFLQHSLTIRDLHLAVVVTYKLSTTVQIPMLKI